MKKTEPKHPLERIAHAHVVPTESKWPTLSSLVIIPRRFVGSYYTWMIAFQSHIEDAMALAAAN